MTSLRLGLATQWNICSSQCVRMTQLARDAGSEQPATALR